MEHKQKTKPKPNTEILQKLIPKEVQKISKIYQLKMYVQRMAEINKDDLRKIKEIFSKIDERTWKTLAESKYWLGAARYIRFYKPLKLIYKNKLLYFLSKAKTKTEIKKIIDTFSVMEKYQLTNKEIDFIISRLKKYKYNKIILNNLLELKKQNVLEVLKKPKYNIALKVLEKYLHKVNLNLSIFSKKELEFVLGIIQKTQQLRIVERICEHKKAGTLNQIIKIYKEVKVAVQGVIKVLKINAQYLLGVEDKELSKVIKISNYLNLNEIKKIINKLNEGYSIEIKESYPSIKSMVEKLGKITEKLHPYSYRWDCFVGLKELLWALGIKKRIDRTAFISIGTHNPGREIHGSKKIEHFIKNCNRCIPVGSVIAIYGSPYTGGEHHVIVIGYDENGHPLILDHGNPYVGDVIAKLPNGWSIRTLKWEMSYILKNGGHIIIDFPKEYVRKRIAKLFGQANKKIIINDSKKTIQVFIPKKA